MGCLYLHSQIHGFLSSLHNDAPFNHDFQWDKDVLIFEPITHQLVNCKDGSSRIFKIKSVSCYVPLVWIVHIMWGGNLRDADLSHLWTKELTPNVCKWKESIMVSQPRGYVANTVGLESCWVSGFSPGPYTSSKVKHNLQCYKQFVIGLSQNHPILYPMFLTNYYKTIVVSSI
jgi:hypothetical protein